MSYHPLSYDQVPKHSFATTFVLVLTAAGIAAVVVCHYLSSLISLPLL